MGPTVCQIPLAHVVEVRSKEDFTLAGGGFCKRLPALIQPPPS